MVILGSASPRRRTLLAELGIDFIVRPAVVDEDVVTTPDPVANVLERARLKAAALQEQAAAGTGALLITADTVVAVDGDILNKPADPTEARQMLARLRDRWHEVHTAIVVAPVNGAAAPLEKVVTTAVAMRPYSPADVDRYIASGDPFDKAGGYAIQHPDFRPVAQIEGCYTSVVGFPLCHVRDLLAEARPDLTLRSAGLTSRRWGDCDLCRMRFSLGFKK